MQFRSAFSAFLFSVACFAHSAIAVCADAIFLSFVYGWLQCMCLLQRVYGLLGLWMERGGLFDIISCIWILVEWLWVVLVYVVGLSL